MNDINESNITKAEEVISKIDISSEEIINTLDLNLEDRTQIFLAQLYNSEYGVYLAKTYFGIPLANLIAAFLLLIFFLFLRRLFTKATMLILQPLTKRTKTFYDDRILFALKGPISFMFVIIGVNLFFTLIFLETPLIKSAIDTMIVYNIFWVIYALTHALRGLVYHFANQLNPELGHEMGNFILAIVRGIIIAIGLGAILQVWGINVAGLVAGLGIGGLAFALAAKDTAANLFGSIALLLDKSIRIGEWIKIGGVEGTVEDIGMRTTKIRAFGKGLITLPNQMIANSPIENFSRRKVRRIKMTIGITYGATSTQISNIVADIKAMLQNHGGISQNSTMLVNFTSFDDSSLGIFIYTFANTAVWAKYMTIKEDVNLKIMKIVEENNAEFAFPSQSIYIENMPNQIDS